MNWQKRLGASGRAPKQGISLPLEAPLDVGTEVILSSHIDLLEDIMNDPRSLSENVKKKSEISYEVGHTIERRATYLR